MALDQNKKVVAFVVEFEHEETVYDENIPLNTEDDGDLSDTDESENSSDVNE